MSVQEKTWCFSGLVPFVLPVNALRSCQAPWDKGALPLRGGRDDEGQWVSSHWKRALYILQFEKKEATNPFPKMLTFKSNFLAYKKYQRKHLKILLKQRNWWQGELSVSFLPSSHLQGQQRDLRASEVSSQGQLHTTPSLKFDRKTAPYATS